MIGQDEWRLIGDLAFFGFAAVSLTFVVIYGLLSPWWRTETGRNIMFVMASMAATAVYFAFAIQQRGIPFAFFEIRAALFIALFVAVAWRVVMLVRAQLLARRKEKVQ